MAYDIDSVCQLPNVLKIHDFALYSNNNHYTDDKNMHNSDRDIDAFILEQLRKIVTWPVKYLDENIPDRDTPWTIATAGVHNENQVFGFPEGNAQFSSDRHRAAHMLTAIFGVFPYNNITDPGEIMADGLDDLLRKIKIDDVLTYCERQKASKDTSHSVVEVEIDELGASLNFHAPYTGSMIGNKVELTPYKDKLRSLLLQVGELLQHYPDRTQACREKYQYPVSTPNIMHIISDSEGPFADIALRELIPDDVQTDLRNHTHALQPQLVSMKAVRENPVLSHYFDILAADMKTKGLFSGDPDAELFRIKHEPPGHTLKP